MDDELICPCCQSRLGVDSAGDLYAIEDNLPGSKGVNGIRTTTVGGSDWQSKLYRSTEPQRYQPPAQMREPGLAGNQKPIEADPELIKASHQDWNQKNIKLTETNDNE